MDNEVTIEDDNCVAEEGKHLNSKAMNDDVAIAHANGVAGEVRVLKSEPFSNGVGVGDKGVSGGVECLRTYKRRKKSSSRGKTQEQCRAGMATASGIADQDVKKPCDLALGNTSDDCSQGQWGNIVLNHLYQSLGDSNGGVEGCIREALNPKQNLAPTVMETFLIEKNGKRCSSQSELLSHRTGKEANRHADVMCNGCSSELPDHGVTEMCQRVLCNILTSEKFRSLCKALLENFQGMKPESVFDFTIMNSRMKEQAYEQSPALFLSDIQQVWGKLQDTGNEIVALAKSLSSMSTTSYSELVGVSAPSTFQDEKQPSCNREFGFLVKPEQTQDISMYRIGSCSRCGEKADDKDCLVCDSCEEIFHVSCIEPLVKEIIPHKSWYCARCTANGIGSPHEHCVLCERLNDEQTPNGIIGDESFPTIKETKHEFEENSNCTSDGIEVSVGEKTTPVCKICRNEVDGKKRKKVKICGHKFCSNKYYHVRCLTKKQLKSYGHCWYCPSCLCCVCLIDRDDDQIVICDGCDRGYHIYCLTPPQSSIPSGKWFCRLCDAGIQAIHKAKKAYESNEPSRKGRDAAKPNAKLDKKHRNKRARELERGGAMDMLLTAANTLNFEEKKAAIQIESQTT
ncbi:PHD finger protein [Vigna angularis]|uniref:PHD finger protein n=3 Tax=Phaseolus angularis TaxID=3914 RepID=A0A8T0KIF5_PHAAN|nr:PHD finger protein EHD3 [Vigna angularis]KAG2399790.1 PHD finger protein [Vigna angularis]BAT78706.1 hypothetical protein VIGAN_02142400 [Vigna angularis var. angularis]